MIETMLSRPMAFLLSEAEGMRSRTGLTIAAGSGKLEAGTVIGRISASGKFAASGNAVVAGAEGAESGVAVLGYAVDATDADVDVAAIDRDAEVKTPELKFAASVDSAAKITAKLAQLDAVGIRAR